ncbi:hypothetical protein DRQ07_03475 [candidate division KSB1 bacterium]|nr:MAG: hypothetical protein DRQ07_03475 [candidate division KSB1 bacterium]
MNNYSNRTLLSLCLIVIFIPALLWPQQQDYILLKNGDKLYGRIQISSLSQPDLLITYNDSCKYYLSEISRLQINGEFYHVLNIPQYYFREKFFFRNVLIKRIRNNKIGIFTKEIFKHTSQSYDYFQKPNNSITKVNYENLRKSLCDNKESMKVLNRVKVLNVMKYSLILSGALISIYGYTKSRVEPIDSSSPDYPAAPGEKTRFKISPIVWYGMVVSLSSFVPHVYERKGLNEALNYYNNF